MVHLTMGEVLAKKVLKGGFGGGSKSPLLIKSSGRCHPNKIGLNSNRSISKMYCYYIIESQFQNLERLSGFHNLTLFCLGFLGAPQTWGGAPGAPPPYFINH